MTHDLTTDHLRQFAPFDRLPETHLEQVREQARVLVLPAGRSVFKRGEPAKQCFFLVSGCVDLSDIDFNIIRIRAGENAAHLALDNKDPHSRGALTKEPSSFIVVERDLIDLMMTWDQAGCYVVEEIHEEDGENPDWMQSLLTARLFLQIPPANLQQLFVRFVRTPVHAGDIVIRQGEEGDRFYVIASGKARVVRKTARGDQDIVTLSAGGYFGEEALVSDSVRNATVIMDTDGVLMAIDKEQFKRLLKDPLIKTIHVGNIGSLKGPSRIIDVRLRWEHAQSSIEGSECIPLKDLRSRLPDLPHDVTYLVTCDGGRRSELGAYLFREAGLNAYVLRQ